MTTIPRPCPMRFLRSCMLLTADCAKNKFTNLAISFPVMSLCRLVSPSFPLTRHWRWIFARDYVSMRYTFNKKFTLFGSIGDLFVCLLVFALRVLPVRLLPPAILPSDLGTTTRESPKPQVLEGRPRCIGRDFDEISQAAWLVPPWTSRVAYESSQTFCHPFSYVMLNSL